MSTLSASDCRFLSCVALCVLCCLVQSSLVLSLIVVLVSSICLVYAFVLVLLLCRGFPSDIDVFRLVWGVGWQVLISENERAKAEYECKKAEHECKKAEHDCKKAENELLILGLRQKCAASEGVEPKRTVAASAREKDTTVILFSS